MSRIYEQDDINVICDMCKTEHRTKKITEHMTDMWISELTELGWLIVMVSPLPYGGVDICPECLAKIDGALKQPIIDLYETTLNKENATGLYCPSASSSLQMALRQLCSRYVSEYSLIKKELAESTIAKLVN